MKQAVGVPIIASLNGTSAESWLRFGHIIEQAGADALELNLYDVATDLNASSSAIEEQLVFITRTLKEALRIPIAIKVSPFFAAFANVAQRLDHAGADALVLQPLLSAGYRYQDVDRSSPPRAIEKQRAVTSVAWLAILHGRVRPALAVTGGVATPNDGIKALLAGADVVQLVSALLRHGPAFVSAMREGLKRWMEWHKLPSLAEVRGRVSLATASSPAAFERANYIRALQSWKM